MQLPQQTLNFKLRLVMIIVIMADLNGSRCIWRTECETEIAKAPRLSKLDTRSLVRGDTVADTRIAQHGVVGDERARVTLKCEFRTSLSTAFSVLASAHGPLLRREASFRALTCHLLMYRERRE